MKIISAEQKDLIDAITAEGLAGELSAFVLEKDVHVTDALHALADLRHDHVQFVFCGGTSLSKAHGLIERMSEDVDLKVVLNADHGLSQSALRAHLGKLKIAVVETMQASGFQPIEEEQRALNARTATSPQAGITRRDTPLTPVCGHICGISTIPTASSARTIQWSIEPYRASELSWITTRGEFGHHAEFVGRPRPGL